jgi:hypothetical protein
MSSVRLARYVSESKAVNPCETRRSVSGGEA